MLMTCLPTHVMESRGTNLFADCAHEPPTLMTVAPRAAFDCQRMYVVDSVCHHQSTQHLHIFSKQWPWQAAARIFS